MLTTIPFFFFPADDESNCGQTETTETPEPDSGGLSPGAIAGISIECFTIFVAAVLVALYLVGNLLVNLFLIFCLAIVAAISVNGCYSVDET